MRSILVLLLNLHLPALSFAQECRLKKDASELLSVDYYVDPSGTRYLAKSTVAVFGDSLDLFLILIELSSVAIVKFAHHTPISLCTEI